MDPIELKAGDDCPACGDVLVAVRVPTDEQWKKASDRENPVALPPGYDTANPEQRSDLGALYRCKTCGYSARFKGDAAADEAPRKRR